MGSFGSNHEEFPTSHTHRPVLMTRITSLTMMGKHTMRYWPLPMLALVAIRTTSSNCSKPIGSVRNQPPHTVVVQHANLAAVLEVRPTTCFAAGVASARILEIVESSGVLTR